MCLSVPAKILVVDGDIAKASVGGGIIEISLQLVDDIKPGDYVLVHTGFALEKIDNNEAQKMLQLLQELSDDLETV